MTALTLVRARVTMKRYRRDTQMKWCAMLAGLILMGCLIFMGSGGHNALGSARASATMYAPANLTGVLTAAQELYREKDTVAFSGLL
jgi:hypothetical protein